MSPIESKHSAPVRGLVLSGGGARAAYQVGALKALSESGYFRDSPFSIICGSSMGSVNAVLLAAMLREGLDAAILGLEDLWEERTFANTFQGSLSVSFFRAIKLTVLQYLQPGPKSSDFSIFDPSPILERINQELDRCDALDLDSSDYPLKAVGLMTTRDGDRRQPMLIAQLTEDVKPDLGHGMTFGMWCVNRLRAEHAFASAALPTVLPPVEFSLEASEVRLIDGGICENIPVDPAIRLGAEYITVLDTSGRKWWCDHYGQPHYTRDPWEAKADSGTYCLLPNRFREFRNNGSLGEVLKSVIGNSTKESIEVFGPTWPVFQVLKRKMGEDLAFEIMSYGVLHPAYFKALIALGYNETVATLEEEDWLGSADTALPTAHDGAIAE